MSAEIHCGDAREVLRDRVPLGAVVITDAPWPVQSDGIYSGNDWRPGLLRETLDVCANARRVVVIASALTDPRWLAEVNERWPFVSTAWLRYAVPGYRGTRLMPGNVAHVFGDHRATRGRRVIPCEMTASSGKGRDAPTSHPTPLRMAHAQWCVGQYTEVGDTVVDPFAGSGRILRAAVDAGCSAIGAEINPAWAAEAEALIQSPSLLDGAW